MYVTSIKNSNFALYITKNYRPAVLTVVLINPKEKTDIGPDTLIDAPS